MTDQLITLTLEALFADQVSSGQKRAVIAEIEMMGNHGEYPISHYVAMYLPANLKARAEEATALLLAK
jgi:hypothetical protein